MGNVLRFLTKKWDCVNKIVLNVAFLIEHTYLRSFYVYFTLSMESETLTMN